MNSIAIITTKTINDSKCNSKWINIKWNNDQNEIIINNESKWNKWIIFRKTTIYSLITKSINPFKN